jgi:hypothetical protein
MTPCEIAGCAGERRALVGRAAREPDHAAPTVWRPYRSLGSRSASKRAIAPIENIGPGAISLGHFGWVGLDPGVARLTTQDEPDPSRSRVAERHRRSGMRIHETRPLIPEIDIWRVATLMLKRYSNEAMMKRTEPSRQAGTPPRRRVHSARTS